MASADMRRSGLKFVIADAPAAGLSGGRFSSYDEAWLKKN
jgi:hypothetical protein